jgi:hypothetical protein
MLGNPQLDGRITQRSQRSLTLGLFNSTKKPHQFTWPILCLTSSFHLLLIHYVFLLYLTNTISKEKPYSNKKNVQVGDQTDLTPKFLIQKNSVLSQAHATHKESLQRDLMLRLHKEPMRKPKYSSSMIQHMCLSFVSSVKSLNENSL